MAEREEESGHARSVLLVPGFTIVPIPWHSALVHYRKSGLKTSIVPYRIEDMRDTVTYAGHVSEIVKRDGITDIVGLSMGGVAALYAVKFLGIARRIRTLVAVGSPFRGAGIAFLGLPTLFYTTTGRQFRAGSAFLRELRDAPLPEGVRFVSLCGELDAICPAHACIAPDADNIIVRFRHVDLIASPMLHRVVIGELLGTDMTGRP